MQVFLHGFSPMTSKRNKSQNRGILWDIYGALLASAFVGYGLVEVELCIYTYRGGVVVDFCFEKLDSKVHYKLELAFFLRCKPKFIIFKSAKCKVGTIILEASKSCVV